MIQMIQELSFQTIIDWLLGFSFVYNTLIYVPQAIRLLREKKSEQLSLGMFFLFDISFLIQISYMFFIAHDEEFVLGALIVFTACLVVTYLIAFYKIKACFLQKHTPQNAAIFFINFAKTMLAEWREWKKYILAGMAVLFFIVIYFLLSKNGMLRLAFNLSFILVALSYIVQVIHLVRTKHAKQLS